ncbi:MAG TPA: DUF4185 domain-containing protein [Stellaceae bacterium]|nr:DUF4185 domain-containing protein [Stellaceae bacterium]
MLTTAMGSVRQNPVIDMRDGTQSALFAGRSIWTFGDTAMSVPGVNGTHWDDNSLSWTTNRDAAGGITLDHDLVDSTGAPREYLPYTRAEQIFNDTHDAAHCTAQPCGAEIAMWSAQAVSDPARDRLLLFYVEITRVAGKPNWKEVGSGIAVYTPGSGITRPIENSGSATPTLMWSGSETGYIGGSVVAGGYLFSYGCAPNFVVMDCRLARVPLAAALDKSQWAYYAGGGNWSSNETDAVTVFEGGAAGNSVFYVPYLQEFMAIYSQPFSDQIMYRVAYHPGGPWSDAGLLFTGAPGWQGNFDYAAFAHPEFASSQGRIQYVTYVQDTGPLNQQIPLTEVVFGDPAGR